MFGHRRVKIIDDKEQFKSPYGNTRINDYEYLDDAIDVLEVYNYHCGPHQCIYKTPTKQTPYQKDVLSEQLPGMSAPVTCEVFSPIVSYGSLRQLRDADIDPVTEHFVAGIGKDKDDETKLKYPEDLTAKIHYFGTTDPGTRQPRVVRT